MTAAELRAARERLGLTQEEVAAALGVDLRTYRRAETGERPMCKVEFSTRAAIMVLRLLEAGHAP